MVIRKKHTEIVNHISQKEFTILIGARQIGKSTLLKQIAEELKLNGEIVYFLNLERKNVLQELDLEPEELSSLHEPESIPHEIELLEDVTQLYLNEIGAKPLLTPEEELATTRQVIAGDFLARQKMIHLWSSTTSYLRQVSWIPYPLRSDGIFRTSIDLDCN